jgi:hypothetical protein
VAALPIVAATVEGLREGVAPTGDRAIILTRSYDVLSGHTPLVGQFSASSLLYAHVVHSPGPLSYWLLALPVRIGAAAPPTIAIAVLNALCVVVAVVLARRRGGPLLAIFAAIALALMCRSLSPETLHDVWNPSVALLPFTLLIFVSWSLACGERRLLPLAVALASFTAQSELVFVAPSLGALTLGMVGLLSTPAGRMGAWRWWLAGLGTFLACWSFPIAEELLGHPGNLTLVAEAAFSHGPTIGMSAGWHALVRGIGLTPWWLTSSGDPFGRLADVKPTPSALATTSCAALLVALVGLLAVSAYRRRGDLAWASAIGLVLCVSLVGMTASTPSRPSLERSLGYMLWIGSPIGMWTWLMLAWSATTSIGVPLPRRVEPLAGRGRSALAIVGLLAALACGATVAAGQGRDQDSPEYGPVKAIQAAVRRALPPGRPTVLVTGSHGFTAFDFRAAVIYDLRRRGLRVYAPAASERLGVYYEPSPGRTRLTVWVFDGPRPPRRGRVIARIGYGSPREIVTVTISRARWPPTAARARRLARRSGARLPS